MSRALLTAVAIALAAAPAAGQSPRRPFGEGTEAFRAVLSAARLKPSPEANKLFDEPQNRVWIVFGRTDLLDPYLGRLKSFLDDGGAVLIATDRPTSDGLFEEIGVQVSGSTIMGSPDPDNLFRNMRECPLIREIGNPLLPSRLLQGTGAPLRVATNLPSEIIRYRDALPFATQRRPGHEVPQALRRLRFLPLHDQSLLGVMGSPLTWTKGRLLVLADHSIFINDMMLAGDNDNIQFAVNVVNWLADTGDGRRRTQCVFLDDGKYEPDFNVSLEYPTPPIWPVEALVPMANEAIAAVERDNFFNNLLLELTGGPGLILRTIAFVLTFALLMYGLYRFLQSRYRPESRLPANTAGIANDGLTAAERRHQAVLARGNLAEAARELAVQAFLSVGLTPAADVPPPAVVGAGWFGGRRWSRQVGSLWNLAIRGPGHRVSPSALQRLDNSVRELLAAVAAGRVRLANSHSPI